MQEPYSEDVAGHTDPESCHVEYRKDACEALTGAHAGQPLSREIDVVRGADAIAISGRRHRPMRQGEHRGDPARSETLRMHGNTSRENREAQRSSPETWRDRGGKPKA